MMDLQIRMGAYKRNERPPQRVPGRGGGEGADASLLSW